MYCPSCGQQQTSDELRFCSRCGLKLDAVRACLPAADDTAPDARATPTGPRRGDINAGVALVFLSVLVTSAFVAFTNIPPAGAALVLTLVSAPLLLSSGHLLRALRGLFSDEPAAERAGVRPREVGFGAALMLVCTALSFCAASIAPGRLGSPVFFFALLSSLVVLLLSSRQLLLATQRLFREESSLPAGAATSQSTPGLPGRAASANALPPAEGVPVPLSAAAGRTTTAEMSPPPSVAERTTSLLDRD